MSERAINSPWLRNPVWDGFWLLSGVWLVLIVALFLLFPDLANPVLILATLVLWLSHRFATTFTAFCTPAYLTLIKAQRQRFLHLPLTIIILVFLVMLLPEAILPLQRIDRIIVLATIFFLYNTYHFGVQHYGVLTIYRIRARQSPHTRFKRYERYFCLAVGGLFVAIGQIYLGAQVVEDSFVYELVMRDQLAASYAAMRLLIPTLILTLTAIFLVYEWREETPSLPKSIYVCGLALQGVLAFFLPPVAFLFLWGVQHWLVSVALAAHMAENDTSDFPTDSGWYRFWSFFNRDFTRTVLALAAISIVLTPFFEFSVHPESVDMVQTLAGFFAPLQRYTLLTDLLIAAGFATVFIHFVMDRAVFRFSDAEVRAVTGPLLFIRRN